MQCKFLFLYRLAEFFSVISCYGFIVRCWLFQALIWKLCNFAFFSSTYNTTPLAHLQQKAVQTLLETWSVSLA